MIDFYFLIHYVIYRFGRRHKEDPAEALFRACIIQGIFSICLIICLDDLVGRTLGTPCFVNETIICISIALFGIFEYFVLYHKERYIDIFDEYGRESNTPEMQAKFKKAKIFNYCIFAMDIIMLFTIDYLNRQYGPYTNYIW